MSELRRKTLLLVEDEVLIGMAEKMMLETYGYTVKTSISGEQAIEAVQANAGIDLILIDIDLGSGIDGTETARQILKDRDLPIIFLSSHTEQDIVEKTEKITSYGYVVKNSSITVLDASIKMAFKLFEAKSRMVEASEQFRAIVENTADYIMRYDRQGRHLYGNPAALAVSGFTLEQFVGKSHRDLGFPEALCALWEISIEHVFNTGVSRTIEFETELLSGPTVLQLKFSPEFDARGSVHSVIGVSRDITDLKRTQENLSTHQIELEMQNGELRVQQVEIEALHLRYFDLYDMAPVADFTLSQTGLILEANLTAAEMLGLSRNELITKQFAGFITTDSADTFYLHGKQLFATGMTQHYELRMKRHEGTVFAACMRSVMALNAEGAPTSRVVVMELDRN